ncbi:phosphatidyl-N-methylethanolamine N-methyltransferase [Aristolochia californica]|uniref:phosphatidyl-N-methylethanolamine N-methyltransferase n=1 Tax=Aristolochia californica TaxID=171875 RepID=UPI0035D531FE
MSFLVCLVLLLPFIFYYFLWTFPQSWADLCGKETDPSHRMAQISHFLKILQLIALFSVAQLSWPPWYCWVLLLFGQYLNFKVYQLLGEPGTYYGVRFGKNIPWVKDFPFGYIRDPQYVGSIMSLIACLWFVPFQYILVWVLGYLFMMKVESKEDQATRAMPLS